MSDLLDFVLQAHGGLQRWRKVQSLDVRVSLAGSLYRLKGCTPRREPPAELGQQGK